MFSLTQIYGHKLEGDAHFMQHERNTRCAGCLSAMELEDHVVLFSGDRSRSVGWRCGQWVDGIQGTGGLSWIGEGIYPEQPSTGGVGPGSEKPDGNAAQR